MLRDILKNLLFFFFFCRKWLEVRILGLVGGVEKAYTS